MKKSLVLTGMMGVGKSTVGKLLATKLKFKFLDIDKLIEKDEKSSIKKIFDVKGEEYFRKIEKKLTLRNLKRNRQVISLGGGSFIDPVIRAEVLKKTVSFWLDLNIKYLSQRKFRKKDRPLLVNDIDGKKLFKIYLSRKKIYNLADFRIKCDYLKHNQVAKKIINIYEKI